MGSSAVPERKLRQKGHQPLATGLRLANVCQEGLGGTTGSDETALLQQRSIWEAKISRGWQQLAVPFPWGSSVPVPRV